MALRTGGVVGGRECSPCCSCSGWSPLRRAARGGGTETVETVDKLPAPVASRSCTTPTPKVPDKLPKPSQVTVAVANGTDRAGLAVDTADAFATRGFVVGDIGNTERPVDEGVALVRYRDQDLAAAVVVASYVPGAQLRPVQRVPDGDVALWLGPDFDGVVSASEADPASVAVPPGEPRCRKVR